MAGKGHGSTSIQTSRTDRDNEVMKKNVVRRSTTSLFADVKRRKTGRIGEDGRPLRHMIAANIPPWLAWYHPSGSISPRLFASYGEARAGYRCSITSALIRNIGTRDA